MKNKGFILTGLAVVALVAIINHKPEEGAGITSPSFSGGCSSGNQYYRTNFITITKRWSETIVVNPEGRPQMFDIIIGANDTKTPYTCIYNAGIKGAERLVKVPAYSEWVREEFTPVKVEGAMTVRLALPSNAPMETGRVYYAIVPAR